VTIPEFEAAINQARRALARAENSFTDFNHELDPDSNYAREAIEDCLDNLNLVIGTLVNLRDQAPIR